MRSSVILLTVDYLVAPAMIWDKQTQIGENWGVHFWHFRGIIPSSPMRLRSLRELGARKIFMTQAGKLIKHCNDLATVLVVATRAVEPREILSLLRLRWDRMLPIRPKPYETDPITPRNSAASLSLLANPLLPLSDGLLVSYGGCRGSDDRSSLPQWNVMGGERGVI
jgi:hypothetical protein